MKRTTKKLIRSLDINLSIDLEFLAIASFFTFILFFTAFAN